MIPLTVSKKEISILKYILDKEKAALEKAYNVQISYVFGTMIELPRTLLKEDELGSLAHFFFLGTNDLTQATLAISNDDFSSRDYSKDNGIFYSDLIAVLDEEGVGKLVALVYTIGKKFKKNLELVYAEKNF